MLLLVRATMAAALTATAAGLMAPTSSPALAGTTGTTRQSSDFNGDGYQDIAIGATGGMVDGVVSAGYVTVIYGSRSGLDVGNRQTISQASEGVPDDPEAFDNFGASLAAGDFNADGYADLAVGASGENIGDNLFTGSATVLFGSPTGLGHGFLLPGDRGAGHALGAGDVNGDGQVDLLANDRLAAVTGTVDVYTFPPGGFDNPAVTLGGEGWGGEDWIATGDVNSDGYADVLAAWTAVGGTPFVNYLPGSANGINGDARTTVDGGTHIAAGDINRDRHADLVIGQTRDLPALGGRIQVWYGTDAGLDEAHTQTIDQETPGVPGEAAGGDEFGAAVAVGDVTGDGYQDVAVGVQSKPVAGATRAGEVVVLRGAASGLVTTHAQAFTQDTHGIPDVAEQGDLFGWMVTLIDHDNDGRADLTAAAIGEDRASADALFGNGAVTVLRGTAKGLTAKGAKTFGPALVGADPTNAHFGWSLTP